MAVGRSEIGLKLNCFVGGPQCPFEVSLLQIVQAGLEIIFRGFLGGHTRGQQQECKEDYRQYLVFQEGLLIGWQPNTLWEEYRTFTSESRRASAENGIGTSPANQD